jgi:uncharacterized protein YjbI with pentapeptide repeats
MTSVDKPRFIRGTASKLTFLPPGSLVQRSVLNHSGILLNDVEFVDSTLSGDAAMFVNCIFRNCKFSNSAKYVQCGFTSCKFDNVTAAEECNFRKCVFTGVAKFEKCTLNKCKNVDNRSFLQHMIKHCFYFVGSKVEESNLRFCTFGESCKIEKTQLKQCIINKCVMDKVELSSGIMEETTHSDCVFYGFIN